MARGLGNLSMAMASDDVARQFEKLMDETSGQRNVEVILQMKASDAEEKALNQMAQTLAETEAKRSMLVDSSELLPPSREDMTKGSERSINRRLRQHSASLTAQVAKDGPDMLSAGGLRGAGSRLAGFTRSAIVSDAVGAFEHAKIQEISTADSVFMKVRRDDLGKIQKEKQDELAAVFENRYIPVPKFSVNKSGSSGRSGEPRYAGVAWGIHSSGACAAWGAFNSRGAGARVAVLDTGIDGTHPDISNNMADWAEFDGQGNEVVGSTPHDSGSHGTHVSGTIAGSDESGQWIGMAPEATLMGGLVLKGGGGTDAQILAGMDWAIRNNSDVINMSLGGLELDTLIQTPYRRQILFALSSGILVVAAIGNDGSQLTGAPGNDYLSLAAGAHDIENRCAAFSGGRSHIQPPFSATGDYMFYQKPDMSAPGVDVKSCVPGGGWESFNGTSMATPHVAGAAALILAATDIPQVPAKDRAWLLRDLLEGSVRKMGEAGKDQRFGHGALDVHKAIDVAKSLGY